MVTELTNEQAEARAKELHLKALSLGKASWSAWPIYQAAEIGLRNYWYPVMWANDVQKKPVPVTILGEKIMLIRDHGKIFALADRCSHRGVPLHYGNQQFPGTITCPYHGWTYSLESGVMCAAITDGPSSPIACKVAVKTYPVEERVGLVWIFVGDTEYPVPPVEADMPDELVHSATDVMGRITPGRSGNWRYAAENGFDEGHAKFLHRNTIWAFFRQMPVWTKMEMVRTPDNLWASRRWTEVHWDADFPDLGKWTQARWWKVRSKPGKGVDPVIAAMQLPGMVSVRVPYILRVAYKNYLHLEWAIPEDADHHRYVQLMVSFKKNWLRRLMFRLEYWIYIRWAFHGHFTGQDAWMVDLMEVPPERLYRPDSSVIGWRNLVEEQARGIEPHIQKANEEPV